MALDAATAQEMLKQLADDRTKYLDTLSRAHDVLAQALTAASSGKPPPRLTTEAVRRTTGTLSATLEVESVPKDSGNSVEEESDTDDDESLFVQQTLPKELYDEEGLRKHIKEYEWTEAGREILDGIAGEDQVVQRGTIFPNKAGEAEDRSHLSHYSIYNVGNDGAPLHILNTSQAPMSRALEIWHRIRSTNAGSDEQRLAVGRITIIREPSPLLFAALHYTMRDHFDMDEAFQLLVDDKTTALPHRPFDLNPIRQRTFVFAFEYFTIVGDECVPMKWQRADERADVGVMEGHVPISRCCSVVALWLGGELISKIKNRNRKISRKIGDVYDPFGPWHVLSMQAYPDWKSSVHSHDSTKHYVNGPEAFLMTLRAEFKDAQKRLMEVYSRISDLVRSPPEFMFKQSIRDRLLFEDDDFTFIRRYFWAQQSLGIMNEDINEMISAYRMTFTDNVWNGSDKIIWPGDETQSSRYAHWRRRMAGLRKDIEHEICGLEEIDRLNDEKIKEIKGLRDNLFSGTSVLESRRSVQQQAITVQQGRNIRLLTLVTIFFLPLTFVTSVFGMTNMNPTANFRDFGIVLVVICIPTYILIGSLNTKGGLQFWLQQTKWLHYRASYSLAWTLGKLGYKPRWTFRYLHGPRDEPAADPIPLRPRQARSQSASDGMAARGAEYAPQSPGSHNTYMMGPAATLERSNDVKFDAARSFDTPRSPIAEKLDSQQSGLHRHTSLETKSERKIQDFPQDAKEGFFTRVLNYKWKVDAKDNRKDLC